MKALRILLTIATIAISQSIFAEKFVIVNNLDVPVQCKVYSGDRYMSFDGTIPAKQESPLIDIHRSTLTWIWWSAEGMEFKAMFEGTVPLQKDKKNFFNIDGLGKFMHNFGGFKKEGRALFKNKQTGQFQSAEV